MLRRTLYSIRMFAMLRLISCVILAISLGTYGIMARAEMAAGSAAMEMVICATGGPVTISVDNTGNPVTPASHCCDCVACNTAATGLIADVFQLNASAARVSDLVIQAQALAPHPSHNTRPQARGPPPAKQIQGMLALDRCYGRTYKDIAA